MTVGNLGHKHVTSLALAVIASWKIAAMVMAHGSGMRTPSISHHKDRCAKSVGWRGSYTVIPVTLLLSSLQSHKPN